MVSGSEQIKPDRGTPPLHESHSIQFRNGLFCRGQRIVGMM
jgi:hypothetical protein